MKNRLKQLLMLALLLIATETVAKTSSVRSVEDRITSNDLKTGIGEWTGSLTNMDYSSIKPYTMPANLTVEEGKTSFQFILNFKYPNEPKANSKGKFEISKNGKQINKKDVVLIERTEMDELLVKTEHSGKDNRKKAVIRNMYIISEAKFILSKEVRFQGSSDWLQRNECSIARKQ